MATKKKTTKKKTTKAKYKTCSVKGCRRKALANGKCKKCSTLENTVSTTEGVKRLTEVEALKFGKLDAEIRNGLQGLRLLAFEAKEIQAKYQTDIKKKQDEEASLRTRLQQIQPGYNKLIEELAKKYGIDDPQQMVVDTDSRIVRDVGK